jgi:hypothetical protein
VVRADFTPSAEEERAPRGESTDRQLQCGRYTQPAGTILRSPPRVLMMQASDHGHLDDSTLVGARHRSRLRCVLLQGKVSPATVVVGEVVSPQVTQVRFVQDHDVVEALAAQGPNEALHVRILPRGPGRRLDFVDLQGLGSAREHDPVHRIAVAQEVARGSLPGARWAVHWAVGVSVTLMWTARRRSCTRTTKTNKTLNVTVGTIKKSTETSLRRWLSRKLRHVCDGGFVRRPRYLDTAACEISMPSF